MYIRLSGLQFPLSPLEICFNFKLSCHSSPPTLLEEGSLVSNSTQP